MLMHFFGREDGDKGQGPGGHAFSADLHSWTFAGEAYNLSLLWEDGSVETLRRRERPFVLIDEGLPAYLFTAVSPTHGLSYTLAQAIARPEV